MGRFSIENKEEERINYAHAKLGKDVNDMPHRAESFLPGAFLGLSPRSATCCPSTWDRFFSAHWCYDAIDVGVVHPM